MAKSSTSFKPGQSGNPGGRPKAIGEFREACREQSPEALRALVRALKGRDRVAAAKVILENAWGKPAQALTVGGDAQNPLRHRHALDLEALADQELDALHRIVEQMELRAAAGAAPYQTNTTKRGDQDQ